MTKVILTCGPSCESDEILLRMSETADAFRLNIAHLSKDNLKLWFERLNRLSQKTSNQFSVILDLQGAKVRIGTYPACEHIPEKVELFSGRESSDPARIPVPAESVFLSAEAGDILLLNDRKIILKVTARTSDSSLTAETVQNGPLSSNKGINSQTRAFEFARVTPADAEAIALSRDLPNIAYAVSFVRDGSESRLFRPLTGDKPLLIAKIEQRSAMTNLEKIADSFDELWFCRGDMGAEAGLRMLGKIQNDLIKVIPDLKKPVILAGEVLGSMTALEYPSRAEIVQLYDALRAGFSGIVLSDETACGKHVPEVTSFLSYFLGK